MTINKDRFKNCNPKIPIIVFCLSNSKTKLFFETNYSSDLDVTYVENHIQFQTAFNDVRAKIIICDLTILHRNENNQNLIKTFFSNRNNIFSLVFVSKELDLSSRLKAIRYGGDFFLESPIRDYQFANILEQSTEQGENRPYRVLMICNNQNFIFDCKV